MNIVSKIKKAYWNADGWLKEFDETNSVFIHIPKAAGTSIAKTLYGKDPWHYTINHYKFLSAGDFELYFKFGFVRNPYERLYSIYKYSFKQTAQHPTTSIAFLTQYPTFEQFINEWLKKDNIEQHYFFYPQTKYLCNKDGKLLVDYVGRFENLEADFKLISNKLNINKPLAHINKSTYSHHGLAYTKELANKVYLAYQADFELFNYSDNSWENIPR